MLCDDLAKDTFHNHAPDATAALYKYTAWKTQKAAKSSNDSTAAIIANNLDIPHNLLGALPKYHSQQRMVQRARESSSKLIIQANSRAELPDLEGMFLTDSGEDFLKWDSGRSSDRILLFSTDSLLDCLTRSSHWFSDGTFKSQPVLFDQL